MLKRMGSLLCAGLLLIGMAGCANKSEAPRLGVSFGVGKAVRWQNEKAYMEQRAAELGAQIEVRLNLEDKPKTQVQDCIEMIDSGIDVLILTPRDVNNVDEILDYAGKKKVKVISYARTVRNRPVDLLVGYDTQRIGQSMGTYLAEKVYEGDYILLKGDENDFNAPPLFEGAMRDLQPLIDAGAIRVVREVNVKGWEPDEAARLVKEAVEENGGQIDAILAPNDGTAGGCVRALEELGVDTPVAITGMDAELDALRRIARDQQDITIHMDLQLLANTAIEQACLMASGKDPEVNAMFDTGAPEKVEAFLINGQIITKENIDAQIIEKGFFTHEEIYS